MLEGLLPGIRDLTLLPVDRLGLQNDLFSLVSGTDYRQHYTNMPFSSTLMLNNKLDMYGYGACI